MRPTEASRETEAELVRSMTSVQVPVLHTVGPGAQSDTQRTPKGARASNSKCQGGGVRQPPGTRLPLSLPGTQQREVKEGATWPFPYTRAW